MAENYGVENIQHLETREAIRTRIQMYLGSDDTDGIYQALKEIINNSTDEAIAGYGKEIDIRLDEESNTVEVRDYGRGVPFGVKDGRNFLVAIYTESHTGGKFDKNAYKNSSGLNGIGGTAVCMSSLDFLVRSIRDNKVAEAYFHEGNLQEYKEMTMTEFGRDTGGTGTYVRFTPDKEVFKNMTEPFSYDRICEEIKNIAYLNKGIRFVVETTQGKKKEYFSENGIADFIKDKVKNPLMNAPIIASAKDDTDELEIAFMWTGDPTQEYVFVNGLYCPFGGSPVTGAKTKITTKIKNLSGKSFDPELIRKGLVFAINCKVANPSFANQTKSKINNPNLRTLASEAFEKGLTEFSALPEYAALIESLEKFQKAEKAADALREKILNAAKEVSEMRTKKGMILDKVSDAKVLGENSRLLICEGKSASGSAKKGRDKDTMGIFEARGKIINGLSSSEDKFLDNGEIKQLQVAVGFDYGKPLNIKKLRYGYIDFFVDPDVDGLHIFLLGLVAIWKICPEFVKQGRVGWYHAPLFIVENKGKQTYFYTDEDYNERGRKLPGNVRRVKGLGLLEKKELREAIFDCPEAHEIFEYTPEAMEALEALMGADVGPKKEFIFENIDFSKYGEM
ncbi:MAG: hypothetical protein IKU15_02740 [Clostridia bacterium]|nr:hypothetical protein [Clostridia bacterium]